MYHPSGKKLLLGASCAMAILAASACQSASSVIAAPQSLPLPAAASMARQLIVKFKPNTIACDATGIAQLSSTTGITLEYVRPMSGAACVIRQFGDSADDISQGQELLRQNPAVEWLEQDEKKKAL